MLAGEFDGRFALPDGFRRPRIVLPGIVAVEFAAGACRHPDPARHSERSEESLASAAHHSNRSEESRAGAGRHSGAAKNLARVPI